MSLTAGLLRLNDVAKHENPMIAMNRRVLAAAAIFFSVGCATQKASDPDAPAGPPDATVTFVGTQAAYHASGGTGRGTINFQGTTRSFSATAVGAGGSGAQKIDAVGEVYHLTSLADFEGNYKGARSGLTLFKGKMHERLENDKGVVIYVTGSTSGIASSTGLDQVSIKLE